MLVATAKRTYDRVEPARLTSSTGRTATLGALATITELPPQTEIRRENLQRDVSVTARLEGVDLGSGVAAGRTYLDISYRYRKAFKTGGDYSFGQFNVGVGMRF